MTQPALHVGVNLNNRDALLSETYDLQALLELAERAEAVGLDSVWVGDSLFSKPRWESLTLLAALSQRTTRVQLGTACLVVPLRDPVSLALAWATVDQLSGGRTIMGACAGNVEDGVRKEFEALGLDFRTRTSRLEEALQVLRSLLRDGRVTFHGRHFQLDDVSFDSGTERRPLAPARQPPIWVVSNPRIAGRTGSQTGTRSVETPERRVVKYGDGWMTCCRATHPEEVREFRARLEGAAEELSLPPVHNVAYQVTVNVNTSTDRAEDEFRHYISAYYPEFGPQVNLPDWGPAGTADDIAAWMRTFVDAGMTHALVRFASFNQEEQLSRFAEEVLPQLADLRRDG
ncbi:MAG TPA: LLM class flavin-dependent oxidoreductase [Ilumatobacter sp.]|nr:LLM class flavin-dependent oxidoreductase [Ilumatobacter sp.]